MNVLSCKVCGSKVDEYGYKAECTKFTGDFYVIEKCHRCKTMYTYPKLTNLRVFDDGNSANNFCHLCVRRES